MIHNNRNFVTICLCYGQLCIEKVSLSIRLQFSCIDTCMFINTDLKTHLVGLLVG